MSFFSKRILEKYRIDDIVEQFTYSGNVEIVYSSEISRLLRKQHDTRKTDVKLSKAYDKKKYKDLLKVMKVLCSDIGRTYYIKQIEKTFNDLKTYDVVFVFKKDKSENFKDLLGFCIVQKGECKLPEFKDTFVLNLICVKKHTFPVQRLLMFMYVFTMYARNERFGLLELANNYNNISGLCLYNKFGFREDISMKTSKKDIECFPEGFGSDEDIENGSLSMYVDLKNKGINENTLLDALIHSKNIILDPDIDEEEPLCDKKRYDKDTKLSKQGTTQKDDVLQRRINLGHLLELLRDQKESPENIKKLSNISKKGMIKYTRKKASPVKKSSPVKKASPQSRTRRSSDTSKSKSKSTQSNRRSNNSNRVQTRSRTRRLNNRKSNSNSNSNSIANRVRSRRKKK